MADVKLKSETGTEITYRSVSTVSIPNASGSDKSTFIDTSEGTLTNSSQVLSGVVVYSKNTKYTGTMANNTTGGTITTQNGTYTIPAGYTAGGTVKATLPEKAATTYTPSNSVQTIASGVYLSGAQTISAVPTQTKTATANGTITPDSGKYLSSVTVSIPVYSGSVT